MSISYFILTAIIIAIIAGFGQRVLDKLRLSDRWAIAVLILMAVGILLPPITIGRVSFSIGGFLIPLALCIYLLVSCGISTDLVRAIFGTIIVAGFILAIQYLMPSETPQDILIDNFWLYGIAAGLTAYIMNRSRRNAFVSSVLGFFLASVIQFVINIASGLDANLNLGIAGAFDSIVVATLISVVLAESIGTLAEAIKGKRANKNLRYNFNQFVETSKEQELDLQKELISGNYKKYSIIMYNKENHNEK